MFIDEAKYINANIHLASLDNTLLNIKADIIEIRANNKLTKTSLFILKPLF